MSEKIKIFENIIFMIYHLNDSFGKFRNIQYCYLWKIYNILFFKIMKKQFSLDSCIRKKKIKFFKNRKDVLIFVVNFEIFIIVVYEK